MSPPRLYHSAVAVPPSCRFVRVYGLFMTTFRTVLFNGTRAFRMQSATAAAAEVCRSYLMRRHVHAAEEYLSACIYYRINMAAGCPMQIHQLPIYSEYTNIGEYITLAGKLNSKTRRAGRVLSVWKPENSKRGPKRTCRVRLNRVKMWNKIYASSSWFRLCKNGRFIF